MNRIVLTQEKETLLIPLYGKANLMMCLRAKLIDNFTKEYLAKNTDSIALHLGCGLDSRYQRIQNSNFDWYDVDFKEVLR